MCLSGAVIAITFLNVDWILSSLCSACKHGPFPPQMERPGPAGGVAEPLCGARVPAQRHHRQPSPHRASGQSSEPAAGAPGPAARHTQTQPAPAQRYECKHTGQSKGSHVRSSRAADEPGFLPYPLDNSCCLVGQKPRLNWNPQGLDLFTPV